MEPENKLMVAAIGSFLMLMILNALLPIPPIITVLLLTFFFFASSLVEHMDDHRTRLKYEKDVPGPTRWSWPLLIFAVLSVLLVLQVLGQGLQFSLETIAAVGLLGLISLFPWWLGRRVSLRALPRLRTEVEPIDGGIVTVYTSDGRKEIAVKKDSGELV